MWEIFGAPAAVVFCSESQFPADCFGISSVLWVTFIEFFLASLSDRDVGIPMIFPGTW